MSNAVALDDGPEIGYQLWIAGAEWGRNYGRGTSGKGTRGSDEQAADMKQRQRIHDAVAFAVVERYSRGNGRDHHSTIGQLCYLGMASGAAGRQHHRDALRFRGVLTDAVVTPPGLVRLQRLAIERDRSIERHNHDFLKRRDLLLDAGDLFV